MLVFHLTSFTSVPSTTPFIVGLLSNSALLVPSKGLVLILTFSMVTESGLFLTIGLVDLSVVLFVSLHLL